MQQSLSCLRTDRLCIEYDQVEFNQPLEVFWPVGLVPEISDMSKLRIFIYQSDLMRNPQSDPCNIVGLSPLKEWTPLVISDQNSDFPLLRSTSISVPDSAELLAAASTDNNFFLQIKSLDNLLCSIGPYSVPFPFTSFKLKPSSTNGKVSVNNGTVVVNNGTSINEGPKNTSQEVPKNTVPTELSSSLLERKDLQIGIGVGLGLIALCIILIAWILRRKVKSTDQKLQTKQFKEDISKLSIAFGNEFSVSEQDLIPKDSLKDLQDLHHIVLVDGNDIDIVEAGSSSS